MVISKKAYFVPFPRTLIADPKNITINFHEKIPPMVADYKLDHGSIYSKSTNINKIAELRKGFEALTHLINENSEKVFRVVLQ